MTHISLLDKALKSNPGRLAFYAFDLMFLDGLDFQRRHLLDRKAALFDVLARPPGRVLHSDHLSCDGRALFEKVGDLGCEGIVSKRIDAPYTAGPSKNWLKCKHVERGIYPVWWKAMRQSVEQKTCS